MSDYDADIVEWSEHQPAQLRRAAAGEPVRELLDCPNIIEEIEGVGQSQVDAVESLSFQAFVHDVQRGLTCAPAGCVSPLRDARPLPVLAGFAPWASPSPESTTGGRPGNSATICSRPPMAAT